MTAVDSRDAIETVEEKIADAKKAKGMLLASADLVKSHVAQISDRMEAIIGVWDSVRV